MFYLFKKKGNCLGSRKNSDQGQRLGSSGDDAPNTASGGNTLGSSANKGKQSADREAMLAAAEQRRQQVNHYQKKNRTILCKDEYTLL